MLEETSIYTLSDKVSLCQKCQNDVLCGNMNTDVSPYIFKFKLFFKNTCFIMAAWIHFGLPQSKIETIYLPGKVCLIVNHRNPTHILHMSCCHKHEHQRYHNENTKICILIHYMYVDILLSLTKTISIMFERVTTYCQTLKTQIGHNTTRYHKFNALPHVLPQGLPYNSFHFAMDKL